MRFTVAALALSTALSVCLSVPASAAQAAPVAPGPVDLIGLEFQVINAASRQCLTTALVAKPCGRGEAFRWRLRPTTDTGGALQVLNVATGKCLSIIGAGTRDNARADLYTCDGHDSRLWRLRDSTGETARIQNVHSGKCLTLARDTAVQRRCPVSHRWTVKVLSLPLPLFGSGA
ncbi:RICIN domain-containing protein [Paractinoplanes atraurantiacus]|uniref:Ricin-type beta-trefoil lectin domain-like n=1 Tax=Paractinoplanes atraurantiacus TaxID=1036182 RepID=A0A285IDL0_9ACTN|nr:RICIN domain-containing protein [Actinoplanes atraurantiacus]SNY46032.1 Ricin-type beta-trefoil lectin domain-like [Actinoplanes atraurantiacus]